MSSILKTIAGFLLEKVVSLASKIIKEQIKRSRTETKIEKEVKEVKDAVKAIEAHISVSGKRKIPLDLEERLRNAARRLNSNFIDD